MSAQIQIGQLDVELNIEETEQAELSYFESEFRDGQ